VPFAPLILVIISLAIVSHAAEGASITREHSGDIITYLWWALGIMGSFAASVSAGTGVWMLLRVLKHDKEIAVIKARCELHAEEDTD
jgi:hypothetical protein